MLLVNILLNITVKVNLYVKYQPIAKKQQITSRKYIYNSYFLPTLYLIMLIVANDTKSIVVNYTVLRPNLKDAEKKHHTYDSFML